MQEVGISVITTLYNGRKYLDKLLDMVKKNADYLAAICPHVATEYVLVNDSPWEPIDLTECSRNGLDVKILNNIENFGIHKSRVTGINFCNGTYILMLDQDDEIEDTYLADQYRKIKDANVVVANGYKETETGRKKIYRDYWKFSLIRKKLVYLKAANQITSPGQCLIRKKSIPDAWMKYCLKENGSDDLFLWLLYLASGEKFVINDRLLYVHKQIGTNLSNSLEKMCLSDREMCDVMRKNKLLKEKDILKRERLSRFLEKCGYTNQFYFGVWVRYLDIVCIKFFAYYI